MKNILITVAASLIATSAAFAESHGGAGDAEAGAKDFKKCKSCHAITDPDGEKLVKGGKVGPNLWGIVGRTAGTYPDFRYGASIIAAGEAGLVWNAEELIAYAADPKAYLRTYLDDPAAKSKMTFKLADGTDVAAFLATFGPPMMEEEMEEEAAEGSDG